MVSDDALMAYLGVAGLAEDCAILRVSEAYNWLALLWKALSTGVSQVGLCEHPVRLELCPAAVNGDAEVADELGAVGAVRCGFHALVGTFFTLDRDTPTRFLQECMQLNLLLDVESIRKDFEIILRYSTFDLTLGTLDNGAILIVERAERTQAGYTERVEAVKGLGVGVLLLAYAARNSLLQAGHVGRVGFVIGSACFGHCVGLSGRNVTSKELHKLSYRCNRQVCDCHHKAATLDVCYVSSKAKWN